MNSMLLSPPIADDIILLPQRDIPERFGGCSALFCGDAEMFLDQLPDGPLFDLVITSPPYGIRKEYERPISLEQYISWQQRIIEKTASRLSSTGSICWQVGNRVEHGCVFPLDIYLDPIFQSLGLHLRNRIVWHYGHGLHCKKRFSARYETILWYTRSDQYVFDLDEVRIPSKYPNKKAYKGKKKGLLSGNPLGKNPEDVWDIPNVKGNHCEKTAHPCQFPVALAERLVLALSRPKALVFDPFCGAATTGVAALLHDRIFWGTEIRRDYASIGQTRLIAAGAGTIQYRPSDKAIYEPKQNRDNVVPFSSEHEICRQLEMTMDTPACTE